MNRALGWMGGLVLARPHDHVAADVRVESPVLHDSWSQRTSSPNARAD